MQITQRCPYIGCESSLTFARAGWWRCPQCKRLVYVRAVFDELAERYNTHRATDDEAWESAQPVNAPLAEFNPWHGADGRFATGGGFAAPDTGGGGGRVGPKIVVANAERKKMIETVLKELPAFSLGTTDISKITDKPPIGVSVVADKFTEKSGAKVRGYYTAANETIHLSPHVFDTPINLKGTLVHEVGHHVFGVRTWPKAAVPVVNELKKMPVEKLPELGLRPYSLSNGMELMADTYAVWVRGSKSQWTALRKTFTDHDVDPERVLGEKKT